MWAEYSHQLISAVQAGRRRVKAAVRRSGRRAMVDDGVVGCALEDLKGW